jgi:hypothetical protein
MHHVEVGPFYLEQIQRVANFGAPPFKFDVESKDGEAISDRCTLKIPYCARFLNCMFIYCIYSYFC